MSQLPTELIAIICAQSNDHPTIASLCRVSRRFVPPAQEHLFRTVDLEGKSLRILRAWCSTVARHRALADRVHSLALQLPATVAFMSEDAEKLSKALRACHNLKELRISSEKSGQADSVHGWLLLKVPFRLIKLADTYFSPEYYLEETLAQQTEIQVLALPFGVSLPEKTLPAGRLPNLIAMSASLDAIPIDRPLERIEIPCEPRRFSRLLYFSATLTTLNLILRPNNSIDPSLLVYSLLPAILALKHLAVVEPGPHARGVSAVHEPSGSIRRLKQLQTFSFITRGATKLLHSVAQGELEYVDEINEYNAANPEHLREIGRHIFTSKLSLQRVVIGTEVDPGEELLYVGTKESPDASIREHIENKIDFAKFSMFWDPSM